MKKKIVKYITFIISILIANLLKTHIDLMLVENKHEYSPLVFTWIGMGIVLIVYYPLFIYIDKIASNLTDRFLKAGKTFIKYKIGIYLGALIAILVLYYFYFNLWYDRDFLRLVSRSILPNLNI